MIVWGLSEYQITEAAERAGVRINNLRRDGKGYRFTLKLAPSKEWQKVSLDYWSGSETRRKTGSVCWHGHYLFMRECFAFNESARIKATRLTNADYRGLQDFLLSAPNTGCVNVGSMVYPVEAQESCDCTEDQIDKALYSTAARTLKTA